MSSFTYSLGQWTAGNKLPEWPDQEQFGDYLLRIGYASSRATFGSEHGASIELYESQSDASFYAMVCPAGGSCFDVFLPDFPSMMMFLRDFAPAFTAQSIDGKQQEIVSMLEKLFRVYHGHDALSICPTCDPQEWEKVTTRREKRARRPPPAPAPAN